MAQTEVHWDHQIPLPKLAPLHAKIIVALVALLCFINSYDGDFVFDDSEAIVNNKDLNPATPLNNIWRNDFWGSNLSSNNSHKSYRPLTVLTFRLNYLMAGGLHPVGFHVLNIGLHSLISALMIDMFSILLGGLAYDGNGNRISHAPKASLLAGLLFAAHPVHTESGVNAAFDVLLICNVNVYELSQTLFLRRKAEDVSERVRTGLLTRLALLAMGGAFLLYARWRIMGTGPPAFTEIVNYNYYYSLNAWVLLCPWWLCFDWSMGCVPLIKSAFDWRTAWLLLLWCFLIGLISQALCSQDSQRRRTLTLGLVLLVVPFLPACNIFFRVGFVIAERVLYLSSAGYCLLLAYALGHCCGRWSRCKGLLRASLLALLCVYVARCALRSHQWRSEQSLFTSALSVCPLNAKVHYNVGKNLADRGNTSAAIKYYREAVRLHPKYVHAMNNLGNILKERNELVEAEELLAKAVLIQPDFAAAWMNLGIVQNSLMKFKEAEQSYWNAIQFRKKYPDCYYNLGRLSQSRASAHTQSTCNLAQAEAIGREALKLLPNDHTIMFSLANESEGFFLQALKINPNAASCHGNLAVLYHRWGKLELAKKHYELSLKLDPDAPGTRDNYNMLRRKLDQLYRTTPP
ncbi:unnamed protein product [Coregonus sp. 'balchen']|nr:unnamed protein product [Coregonus sp. 'balchen']